MNNNHIPRAWIVLTEVSINALMAQGSSEQAAYNTVGQWRFRGFIPPSMHEPVVAMAHKMDVTGVSHAYLHRQWKRAKARGVK